MGGEAPQSDPLTCLLNAERAGGALLSTYATFCERLVQSRIGSCSTLPTAAATRASAYLSEVSRHMELCLRLRALLHDAIAAECARAEALERDLEREERLPPGDAPQGEPRRDGRAPLEESELRQPVGGSEGDTPT